ncbi:ulp1 protease family, c-terminal catalytic domain [Plakobranchus ocellatus]|uniref:Ulp1 protease family, c-terminal catalytic domain n=1 Tax=Plakobranchus ocellatus TaxID=259542 RepID=A0AAV3Z7R2_9GAST|nr:ulp1 protease family, c-terminal catalytic domain [Plakobranchus ocellatus]
MDVSISINYKGREFVNNISAEVHRLPAVKQKVTIPYHTRTNGLVERSNRTIQDLVMELFSDASLVDDWPKAFPGILFALCKGKYDSTRISAFFSLYRRESKLPQELTGQHFPTKAQADTEWAYSQQQCSSNKKKKA